MAKSKKAEKRLEAHVYFDFDLGEMLRQSAKKDRRSVPQMIRFIVAKHYEDYDQSS